MSSSGDGCCGLSLFSPILCLSATIIFGCFTTLLLAASQTSQYNLSKIFQASHSHINTVQYSTTASPSPHRFYSLMH